LGGSEIGVSQNGGAIRLHGDRKPAERQHHPAPDVASEEGAHALLHALPAAIYTTDAAGHITFYNEAAAALWGCRPQLNADQWCGSWRMYRPDGTPLPHDECPMAVAVKEGRSFTGSGQEGVAERPDGTRVPFIAFPSVLRDSTGAVVGAVNMFFDISERKRAEAASRRAEEELRDFVENANVGMHWVGPDGIILWANRTELDMLGFTADEYIGHHISEFHVDQSVIDDILQRLTNRETLRNCDATLRCKDGTVRHALISSNVLWEGDKFIHTRCITRDITERVQSHAQIAILGREAEHRAKNVLATVQATIELTQADTPDGFKRAIKGRIQALANAHNLFVQSSWTGAELRDLVTQELSPYCRNGETRARIEGATILLEPTTAQTIAVSVHELTTNAAKYGALSLPEGHVQIEWWRAADGRLVVRWTETNGPPVTPPTRRGFGIRAMEAMIRGQLNGDVRFDWRAEGLACEIALMI
jgi:PAS domain S-box-containing protein